MAMGWNVGKAGPEKTHVFPARPVLDFVFVRGAVGVVLAGLGLAVHLLLRRRRATSA